MFCPALLPRDPDPNSDSERKSPVNSPPQFLVGMLTVLSFAVGSPLLPAQEDADEKKAAPKPGKLVFAHGMSLPGTIESATDKTLGWKSDFFSEAVDLRFSALRSAEMEVPAQTPTPEDSLAVYLADGSHFYGNLVRLDSDSIVIQSSRCGRVELDRNQVSRLQWFRQGDLLWSGPAGSAGISHPGKPPVGRRWHGVSGGEVKTVGWKHRGLVPVELPDKVEVEFRLRSSQRPEFEVTLKSRKQNAIIKTWDDEVVIRRAADHLKLLTLTEKDREIGLRVFWDQQTDSGIVANMDGTILGKWLSEGGKPGQRGEVDGIPVVYLAKRELKPPKNPIPDGLAFNNLGRDITIESIRVRRWDGRDPEPRLDPESQGFPRVEQVDGSVLGVFSDGIVASSDGKTLTFAGDGGSTIPLSRVEAIVFSERKRIASKRPDTGFTELKFQDGTRLLAKIDALQDGAFTLTLPASSKPLTVQKDGLFLATFHEEVDPAFTDGTFHQGDRITFEKTSIHGEWLPGDGPLPIWKPPGAESGVAVTKGQAYEIRRVYSAEEKAIPQVDALLHLDEGQVLPAQVTGIGPNGDWIEIDSQYVDIDRFESGTVRAIQYPGAEVNPHLFEDRGWRIVRGKKGQHVLPQKESDKDGPLKSVTLKPGGAWGHASMLQGTEIRFNLKTNGYGTLRLRLFGGNTEAPDSETTRLLLAHFGDEIYCGAERNPGDFGIRQDIRAESNKPVPIRITWEPKKLVIHAKGQQAAVVPVSEEYPRNGVSIVFEPADLWGNGEREITVSDFSLKAAPGMISSPPVLTENKERALTIPRFRRDDIPKQVLLAWNGDLLRGAIESATDKAFSFRTGLETHQIPTDRVAAAIWLTPPGGESDDEEGGQEEAANEASKGQIIRANGGEILINGNQVVNARGAIIGANLGGNVQIINGAVQVAGVQVQAGGNPGETPQKLSEADGHHTIRLHNGGQLTLAVNSFGPKFVEGRTEALGNCRIPTDLVGSIRTGKLENSGTHSAPFLGWNLQHAPEPSPEGGQGGGANSPLVGKVAPPVDLPLLTEGRFKLEKGKVAVLDFWATWCGPCVRALPEMIESFSDFDPEKVQFIAVNQAEGPDTIRKFLERRNWSDLTVALDSQQAVAGAYGVQGIPHTVVIDAEGKVAWVSSGFRPGIGEETATQVRQLLEKGESESSE